MRPAVSLKTALSIRRRHLHHTHPVHLPPPMHPPLPHPRPTPDPPLTHPRPDPTPARAAHDAQVREQAGAFLSELGDLAAALGREGVPHDAENKFTLFDAARMQELTDGLQEALGVRQGAFAEEAQRISAGGAAFADFSKAVGEFSARTPSSPSPAPYCRSALRFFCLILFLHHARETNRHVWTPRTHHVATPPYNARSVLMIPALSAPCPLRRSASQRT